MNCHLTEGLNLCSESPRGKEEGRAARRQKAGEARGGEKRHYIGEDGEIRSALPLWRALQRSLELALLWGFFPI